MERLWAPWRIEFILKSAQKSWTESQCVFYDLQSLPKKDNYVLYRHELAYVVLNIYPYNVGHLLVIPNRHGSVLYDLSPREHEICGRLMSESIKIMEAAMKPQGFNLGMNIGRVAGAGIPNHLHYHVVPRWSGDSNFMPVVAETRTMPESLDGVYARLEPGFSQLVLSD